MVAEIQIVRWCDACLADSDRVRTEARHTYVLSVLAGKPRELDLCDAHAPILQAAVDLVEVAGHDPASEPQRKAAPSTKRRSIGRSSTADLLSSTDSVACPICGRLLKNLAGIRPHVNSRHGLSGGWDAYPFSMDDVEAATVRAKGGQPQPDLIAS